MTQSDAIGFPGVLALVAVVAFAGLLAHPQSGRAASFGIRHWVTVTLLPSSSPLPAGQNSSQGAAAPRVDLRVFVQISDHAIDSRFYGTAVARFSDVDPAIGAGDTTLWEDARCHRERGVPKITLVRIEGAIRISERSIPVTALGRQLGVRLPQDEIIERKGVDDDRQTLMTIDATTKESGFAIRVRLKGETCAL